MARQKKESTPPRMERAPPSFTFPAPATSVNSPEPKKVSRDDVLNALRSFGKGFDKEVQGLLSVPDKLFMLQTDDARFYSKDKRFGVGEVLTALRMGRPVPLDTKYGIAVYSSSSTTYLLLVDMSRRIIVRERLFCLHDEPSEDDWAAFKRVVKDAASLASRQKNSAAVYDGILRAVQMK